MGRNASTLREFLEKKWETGMDEKKTIRLACETLLEIVDSATNIELCVIKNDKMTMVESDVLEGLVDTIKKEKEAAEEAKKNKKA
jgi:20S proteasome alpha/beta subunit